MGAMPIFLVAVEEEEGETKPETDAANAALTSETDANFIVLVLLVG